MTHTPSQMPELKPCPFCGEEIAHVESDDPQFYFKCSDEKHCGISFTVHAENEAIAFGVMNTRAASVPSEVDPLVEAFDRWDQRSGTFKPKPSDKERAEAVSIEYDTPEIAALIFSEWKKTKPSKLAQEIRSRIKIDSGKNEHFPEADLMPSWVWNIADIAAQMALNERALTAPDQSGIWNEDMKRAAMADAAKVCKQEDTIKVLVAALKDAKKSLRKAPLSTFQKIDRAIEQAEKDGV